jgi:hypothetical protein
MISDREAFDRSYTLAEVCELTGLNRKQAEAWIAFGVVDVPTRPGAARVFAFADLVELGMCAMLVRLFGRLDVAVEVIAALRKEYLRLKLTTERLALSGPYLFLVSFINAAKLSTDHRQWEKLKIARVDYLPENLGRLTNMTYPGIDAIHVINPTTVAVELLDKARRMAA